jgi:hypothetical protein
METRALQRQNARRLRVLYPAIYLTLDFNSKLEIGEMQKSSRQIEKLNKRLN